MVCRNTANHGDTVTAMLPRCCQIFAAQSAERINRYRAAPNERGEFSPAQGAGFRMAQGRQHWSKHGKIHSQLLSLKKLFRVVARCAAQSGCRAAGQAHQAHGRKMDSIRTDLAAKSDAAFSGGTV